MVSGIEHRDLWNVREQRLHGANARKVYRVMQGGQRSAGFNGGYRLIINQRSFTEGFAPMDHSMANSHGFARHQSPVFKCVDERRQRLAVAGTGR